METPGEKEKLDPYSQTHFGRTGSSPLVVTETWAGSCVARGVMSYVMGYPMGIGLALLFPSQDAMHSLDDKGKKLGTKIVESWKTSARQGWQNGKMFAKVGVIWATSECVLEGYRGKQDMVNPVLAGCFTGIVLGTGGGIVGMGGGCVGFAAMGLAFDAMMHNMSSA